MPNAYTEVAPPPELAADVQCVWWGESPGAEPILPDGCLDLIVAGDEVFVAGPDTAAWPSAVPAGTPLRGLRFRTGRAPRLVGVPADELRDQRVDLGQLWGAKGERARERLVDDPEFLLRLAKSAAADAPPEPDPLVDLAVERLRRGGPRVVTLLGDLHLSERQFRRRFRAAVGYGPATYLRVTRLQRARALHRREPTASLADIAAAAGYADQQHFSRDSRALTGMTPTELLAPSQS